MNWVDLIIVVILVFFIAEFLRVGFWVIFIDFVSFLLSLIISLRFYPSASNFLKTNFNIAGSLSKAVGFLLVAIISEAIVGFVLMKALARIPGRLRKNKELKKLAIFPAVGETLVLVSFFLTLIVSFPVAPKIKSDISQSKIGGYLIRETSGLESKLSEIFGDIIEDSLTRLIVKPGSRESIAINVESRNLEVDAKAEAEMFWLVNEERKKAGLSELIWRSELVPVARAHATDMWERNYFGHVSPDGKDVGDRLDDAKIAYKVAGENLALSPTTQIAHTGLMNSEGHRANILSPDFNRIGIGVIDNGFYGKMFVQIFTE